MPVTNWTSKKVRCHGTITSSKLRGVLSTKRVAEIRAERKDKTKGPIVYPDLVILDNEGLGLDFKVLVRPVFKQVAQRTFLVISVVIQGEGKGTGRFVPLGYNDSLDQALRDLNQRASRDDPLLRRARTATGGNTILALVLNTFVQ